MPFDETLAARVRGVLSRKKNIAEKKMFGGIGFLLNGKMLVGVWKKLLVARLGTIQGEAALRKPFVRKMDLTGKPLKGWVFVEPNGVEDDDQLKGWIDQAIEFVKELPRK